MVSNNHIKVDPLNDNSGLIVGFWKVNRLSEGKSWVDFFLKQIQLFDIIFLSETWLRENPANKILHPHEYLYENVCIKNKNGKE